MNIMRKKSKNAKKLDQNSKQSEKLLLIVITHSSAQLGHIIFDRMLAFKIMVCLSIYISCTLFAGNVDEAQFTVKK